MAYMIKKKCVCRNGKMYNILSGKLEKCLHCNGTGTKIIETTNTCKYCAEPIESGYFCDSCGRAFGEDKENYQ